MEYVTTKQGGTLMAPPFPPSKKHILGTDRWGYDILSLLLYGARFTLFTVLIVSFLRVAMGGLLGFIFALNKHALDRPKNKVKVNIFSGLPIFIFIYFILYRINLQPVMRPVTLTIIAGVLMVLLGVMNVYNVVYGKTIEIKKNLYVTAAFSMGGSRWHIMKKHIWPAMKSQMLIIFVNEMIQVMHLIGQLGIFNLFLGGTIVQMDPPLAISVTKEWAGLIGQFRSSFYYSRWIIMFPLSCYLLLLLAFYWVAQGLIKREKLIQRKQPFLS
nr:ABC transporter permease subunit [Anoxybacillus tepidamans]